MSSLCKIRGYGHGTKVLISMEETILASEKAVKPLQPPLQPHAYIARRNGVHADLSHPN